MMTRDTWTIIGTMAMIGSIIIALSGIRIDQNGQPEHPDHPTCRTA